MCLKNLIDKASKILDEVMSPVSQLKRSNLTTDYLTLVPQKVVGREWAKEFLDSTEKVVSQQELLRQLRTSLDWFNAQQKNAVSNDEHTDISQFKDLFNVKLSTVKDESIIDDVRDYHMSTLKDNHASRHLRVKNVYELSYPDDVNFEFDQLSKDLGNQKLLWHGTTTGNVLSILREGLYLSSAW